MPKKRNRSKGLTPEQRSEQGRKAAAAAYLKMTPEERVARARKASAAAQKLRAEKAA